VWQTTHAFLSGPAGSESLEIDGSRTSVPSCAGAGLDKSNAGAESEVVWFWNGGMKGTSNASFGGSLSKPGSISGTEGGIVVSVVVAAGIAVVVVVVEEGVVIM
jgi:hypothetical protein